MSRNEDLFAKKDVSLEKNKSGVQNKKKLKN